MFSFDGLTMISMMFLSLLSVVLRNTIAEIIINEGRTASAYKRPQRNHFTVPVRQTGSYMQVTPGQCENVCPTHIHNASRACYRYADEIPPWRHNGPYLSYPCLVCLNIGSTLYSPSHYEVGNSVREAQDMINAIWNISHEAGIPAQLPFSIALQETLGSVRPFNGDKGLSRGLFQVQHLGRGAIPDAHTCIDTPVGGCNTHSIYTMVRQGICGFNDTSDTTASCTASSRPGIAAYWRAYRNRTGAVGLVARGFNSGSIYDEMDLIAVTTGTNSYASDVVNRAMGRVSGDFFARTCCARCDAQRVPVEVRTCGVEDEGRSDVCGEEAYSFHGRVG